jgi:hypothetical protein
MKQAINHESKYPKLLINAKLEEKDEKIEEIETLVGEGGKSYLESVARVVKELNLTITNKGENILKTTQLEINKGKNVKMYDKQNKKITTAIFTDGSYMPDSKKTGVAIVYGPNNTKKWAAKYKSKSFSSELEGLEVALATTKAEIIFCDCLGAINTIKAWKKKLTKKQDANGNRSILRSIDSLIDRRQEEGMNIPEIIWTPSHMDDKNKKMTKTMKEQVTYLKNRFCLKTVIRNNEKVDLLAKEGAEMDGGARWIWNTVDQFYMTDEEQVEETDINKLITTKYNKRYSDKAYDNSGWGGLADVHRKVSNIIFTKNSVYFMKIQQIMWRLRNNCLPNHARQYMKYREHPKDDSMAIMRALLNNTPECEETEECREKGTIADITHLWTCRSNKRERAEYEAWVNDIVKPLRSSVEDLTKWIPGADDQEELDFGAIDVDEEKAGRAKAKRKKREGRLFDCIKERIRLREWNKDSNKRARRRTENEEREIQRQ